MGKPRQAWEKMRKAGGSIFNPKGENMSGPSYGGGDFERFMGNLCGDGSSDWEDALKAIEQAADDAARMAERNAIPTTNPKCYSKPFAKFDKHCKVLIEWHPRHAGEEEDCSDGS